MDEIYDPLPRRPQTLPLTLTLNYRAPVFCPRCGMATSRDNSVVALNIVWCLSCGGGDIERLKDDAAVILSGPVLRHLRICKGVFALAPHDVTLHHMAGVEILKRLCNETFPQTAPP